MTKIIRCPTAAVAETSAEISERDLKALRKHAEEMDAQERDPLRRNAFIGRRPGSHAAASVQRWLDEKRIRDAEISA